MHQQQILSKIKPNTHPNGKCHELKHWKCQQKGHIVLGDQAKLNLNRCYEKYIMLLSQSCILNFLHDIISQVHQPKVNDYTNI